MNARRAVPLWAAALTTAFALAAFVLGQRLASGEPLGASASSLAFAGTLTKDGAPLSGVHRIAFTFDKQGKSCAPPPGDVIVGEDGRFVASIPIDACPAFFDGADVTMRVAVDGVEIATDRPVAPVPYAKFADRLGSPDCPAGYERDITISVGAALPIVCRRGDDDVVKVGTGPSAFWIDRFEGSVWAEPDGTGIQHGATVDDYPSDFPDNGQWTAPLYALSKTGVAPSRSLTWFQASAACRVSGKRLPTGEEWLQAAKGTVDDAACHTDSTPPGPRTTGEGASCRSDWGAEDMIGNLWEWTADWYAGVGDGSATTAALESWPPGYGDDATWNIASFSIDGQTLVQGLPSAALRGGDWVAAARAGMFAQHLDYAPSASHPGVGLRCLLPR